MDSAAGLKEILDPGPSVIPVYDITICYIELMEICRIKHVLTIGVYSPVLILLLYLVKCLK
jgi:hypothetical protein